MHSWASPVTTPGGLTVLVVQAASDRTMTTIASARNLTGAMLP